jgi:virginiamycin B lyase
MRRLLLLPAILVTLCLALAGSAAAAEGELGTLLANSTFANSLAAGPEGNAWFTGANIEGEGGPVVGKVTPSGELTEYKAPGGARSIVSGADGNLWFAEAKGIARITPGGQITSFPVPPGVGEPMALTAGPDGNVWFVTGKPAAGFITPAGAVTTFPLKSVDAPSAITAGPAGDLWFTEPRVAQIGRITVAGKETEFPLPDGSKPELIALGADGNLWFSDGSAARVGRITPTGQVTFFAVPTLTVTDEVLAGSNGTIWFTAGNEIGRISTAGKVTWPGCFTAGCQFPPSAMTIGPEGKLWVASGPGHCPGYCGGGSEISYAFQPGGVGPYDGPPAVTVGIGPRLSPVSKGRTSVVVGCGGAAPCDGTLRLRALTRPHGEFATPQLSRLTYSLAPGQIETVALPFPARRWSHLRAARGFLIVDAIQGGQRVAKRGFYFSSPQKGGVEKHW